MQPGRPVGVLLVTLGVIGVIACIAGAYVAWRVQARLSRANALAFEIVDRGLNEVQEHVPLLRERVRQSKLTTDDVSATIEHWAATGEVAERLTTALGVESRAATLSGYLQAADERLDASMTTVRNIRRLIDLAETMGKLDRAESDRALDLISALRGKLGDAQRLVDEVRSFAADRSERVESRRTQVINVLARILLALTEVERRLDDFTARLVVLRGDARALQKRTDHYVRVGAIAGYAVLAWIAAGNVALFRWGRTCIFTSAG